MTALVPISLPMAGRISVADRDGVPVLQLAGEIDAETVAAYHRDGAAPVPVAAVDLGEVTFLSASAVSFLIRQTKPVRERGHLPAISAASPHARRVLELLGASRLFTVPVTVP
jgi:anti-anti-sigma factor